MKKFSLFLVCMGISILLGKPHALFISFHNGCRHEFEYVVHELGIKVTSWFIWEHPYDFLDNTVTKQNQQQVMLMTHERALRIWRRYEKFFNSFDVIVTSDVAPLSRIFLQNGFKKPLVIWVCNRFDWGIAAGDREYYTLFERAIRDHLIRIVSYTPIEYEYMLSKGIHSDGTCIKPVGLNVSGAVLGYGKVPDSVKKEETLLLPAYQCGSLLIKFDQSNYDILKLCRENGVPCYCGPYNGGKDLAKFKGIIALPHAVSQLSIFDAAQQGVVQFVPSINFIFELIADETKYFFAFKEVFKRYWKMSEWYCKENQDLFVYFDSWQDMVNKVKTLDYGSAHRKILTFARKHRFTNLHRWAEVFSSLRIKCKRSF